MYDLKRKDAFEYLLPADVSVAEPAMYDLKLDEVPEEPEIESVSVAEPAMYDLKLKTLRSIVWNFCFSC